MSRSATLRYWSSILTLALIGLSGILWATRYGLGLREDSFSYITAAESLAAGTGLGRWAADGTFRPLTHFPPLFPILLGAVRAAGADILPAMRLLHAVLFGATILLVGVMTRRLTGSPLFSCLAAGTALGSRVLIEQYAWAHSEPTYLFLSLLALFALASFLDRRDDERLLLGSAALQSLATLARYAGAALSAASLPAILLRREVRCGRRAASTLSFIAIALGPSLALFGYNRLAYGTLADRPALSWHPPDGSAWVGAARTIGGWLLPFQLIDRLSPAQVVLAAGLILIGLAGATVYFLRGNVADQGHFSPRAIGLGKALAGWVLAYAALLMATVFLFDRLTPLNDRILAPIYLAGLLLFAALASFAWSRARWRARTLLAFLALVAGGVHAYRGYQEFSTLHAEGLGLASRTWSLSPTIQLVRGLPPVPIYTNDLPALYFLAGRNASYIPSAINPALDAPRSDYREQLAAMRLALETRHGVLVLLGPNALGRLDLRYLDDLIQGLCVEADLADGVVFRSIAPQERPLPVPQGPPRCPPEQESGLQTP